MVFDSVTFLFRFFPVFMVAYYLIPKKGRNLLLFLGSLFVCSWGSGRTLLILLLSVLTDYMCGLLLDNLREKKSGKLVLLLALCLNLWGLMFGAERSIVANTSYEGNAMMGFPTVWMCTAVGRSPS